MRLTHLRVELASYGPHEGKYKGEAKFENQYGTVEIVLDPSIATKALSLCAEALVQEANKVANLISGTVIDQLQALEDKS